jgi:hypothetical protein
MPTPTHAYWPKDGPSFESGNTKILNRQPSRWRRQFSGREIDRTTTVSSGLPTWSL